MAQVINGVDRLLREDCGSIAGKSVGLVCNQASITADCVHVLDALLPYHQRGAFSIQAVFGPQHGIWGHTQDNMIEWEGYRDGRTGIAFHSLYGEHREPTDAMMQGIDLMVVDLPDIGARYYTFIWTLALCMKKCEELGIPILVLDRGNPINGVHIEGPMMRAEMASFVGLYPLPIRHGLTIAEVGRWLQQNHFPKCQLSEVTTLGWERPMYFDATGHHWALPSPNMPTLDTAIVYPGMCLFEGTQVSEGRGTTRPFEIFGAPYIDGWVLADLMNKLALPGVIFRPIQFEPTFHKFVKQPCQGCFIHVTDRREYESFYTAICLLRTIRELTGDQFKWLDPPYEYVWDRRPIDILIGDREFALALEGDTPLSSLRERIKHEAEAFRTERKAILIYREN